MDWVQFVIEGVPVGCVYALVAVGLVLTYKTSGVFNLAFGSQAFVSAAVFHQLNADNGWPLWASFVVSVLVIAPLIGLALDRFLFRWMRTAPWMVKLAASLGLLVAIPEIVKIFVGKRVVFNPPGIGPLFGIDDDYVWRWSDYNASVNELMTVGFTFAIVIGLGVMFRYSGIGLQMRAVVESPRMVELAGVDSERVSMVAWMLSSFLAGMAGVLLAPLFNSINATNFTLLIAAAAAAAAFGRLTSIPLTLAGGLLLGIGQGVIAGYLPLDSVLVERFRPALPFLVLFLLLIFMPALYKKREVGDPLKGVDPPPPAVAATYKDERLRRASKIALPVFLTGFILVNLFLLSDLWVYRFTLGFVFTIIFLSITVFTGLSGQVSLGQAAFAGIGAAFTGQLATQAGMNVIIAMVIGAVVAGVVGGLLSIPALRLGGIFLAIATLAFALAVQIIVFPFDGTDEIFGFYPNVFGGQRGVDVPRPGGMAGDQAFFLFTIAVFGLVAALVILVRNGAAGRFLAAMRGSETAAVSIGINSTKQRIVVFAFSAAVAGIGGGMFAMLQETTSTVDWTAIFGVAWVAIVLTLGVRTVDGAVNAGMAFVLTTWLLGALGLPTEMFLILFGYGAINFARHPEGVVDFQTRRSIQGMVHAREVNERARRLAAGGRLPRHFRKVVAIVAPMLLVLLFPVYAYRFEWNPVVFAVLVIPPVIWGAIWAIRVVMDLGRVGALGRRGALALTIGMASGALLAATGFLGLEPDPFEIGTAKTLALGAGGGFLAVALILLPMTIDRLARRRGHELPLTWRNGRAPAALMAIGTFVWSHVAHDPLPRVDLDLGLVVLSMASLIVFLQWIAQVQSGLNEYWVADAEAEEHQKVPPAEQPAPIPAPTGVVR